MTENRQQRLKQAMNEAGFTQTGLAKLLGISQPTISDLFNKEGAGSKHIARIAKALGVTALWLDTGKGPRFETEESLSARELELIKHWRSFPPESQKLIFAQIRAVSESQAEDN